MNLLCYNCRGLGNNSAVVRLGKLLRREAADVVVLIETKLSGFEMEGIRDRIRQFEGVYADSNGRSAGLAILWKEGISVEVISSTSHHLDVKIKGLFGEREWRLTGFYGWADTEEKRLSWQLLRDIKGYSNLPWLVIGDFNQILFEEEKRGSAPRSQRDMDDFREALDDCGLKDIGYLGDTFTWWNKREEPGDVFERLDRAVATMEWIDLFPLCALSHLQRDKSDHLPIKLSTRKPASKKKGRRFRFEDLWVSSSECEDVVRDAWSVESYGYEEGSLLDKLRGCCNKLQRWSRKCFGDIQGRIEETRQLLSFLDSCAPTADMVKERKEVCAKLDELVLAEEAY
ncbi:hypothetical protein RND81_04G162300 [Saponaria officinalis]|uniref:Endonuclease/exonuclease/phosphatase domain-containing protein n=1 Tax=Saponaria officinalis TaxID=3572 RepID=A0AAW1LI83_SAPOF